MLEQINPQVILELHRNRLSLDHYYTLLILSEGKQLDKSLKVLYQPLLRKLLCVEMTNKDEYLLTDGGKRLLEALQALQNNQEIVSTQEPIKELKESINEKFETWWQIFPKSDSFIWKNKTFEGSRSLRSNKVETKAQLTKIVAEGEYTAEQVLQGTKNHIDRLKEQSFKDKQNRLTFLPASERYLRLRQFEPWIDKPLQKTPEEKNKPVDVKDMF